jgi:hypothetical protein
MGEKYVEVQAESDGVDSMLQNGDGWGDGGEQADEVTVLKAKFRCDLSDLDERYQTLTAVQSRVRTTLSQPMGWSEEELDLFANLHREFSLRAGARGKYMDRLTLSFPSRPRAELVSEDDRLTGLRFAREKRRALEREWQSAHASLLEDANAQLSATEQDLRSREQHKQELSVFDEEQRRRHTELNAMRGKRAEQMVEELSRKEVELRALAEEQERADEREGRVRAQIRAQVMEHQWQTFEDHRRYEQERQERDEELVIVRARAGEINKERVAYREGEYQQKQRDRKEREEDKRFHQVTQLSFIADSH